MQQKIAVVEDDGPILDAVQMVLENQGWDVVGYTNGEDFLAAVESQKPDCLVLDPHLPGINGLQVLQKLQHNNLRVIILTAQPYSPQIDQLQKLGISEVLLKPVTEAVLIEKVRACMVLPQ